MAIELSAQSIMRWVRHVRFVTCAGSEVQQFESWMRVVCSAGSRPLVALLPCYEAFARIRESHGTFPPLSRQAIS